MNLETLHDLLKYNLYALLFINDNNLFEKFFEFMDDNQKIWEDYLSEIYGKIQ